MLTKLLTNINRRALNLLKGMVIIQVITKSHIINYKLAIESAGRLSDEDRKTSQLEITIETTAS